MYVAPGDWLEILRKEYLQEFICGGGVAVKFLVPKKEIDLAEFLGKIRGISESEGYQFASVDAAETKVHMINHIFHRIAQQVDWDELTFSFLSKILHEEGYKIPSQREGFCIRKIAELNDLEEFLFHRDVRVLLTKRIFHDYKMCQEFRIAMMFLCQAQLGFSDIPSNVIKEWLRGELLRLAEIKPLLIFQKINRQSARHMVSSLSYWLHLAGKGGLVIALNISRCLMQRPKLKDPQDDTYYYTLAATLDAYEVLRQFIDATDDLEFCLMAVIAPPAFLHEEGRRSVFRYDALQLRIWDEVRDKYRANPLSSLILVSPSADV